MKLKSYSIYDIIKKKNNKIEVEKYYNIDKNNNIVYFILIEEKKEWYNIFCCFNI